MANGVYKITEDFEKALCEYTGAPYYAGMASLRFGADLAFVFSSEAASGPIKGYSPELMVVPFYKESDIILLNDN